MVAISSLAAFLESARAESMVTRRSGIHGSSRIFTALWFLI